MNMHKIVSFTFFVLINMSTEQSSYAMEKNNVPYFPIYTDGEIQAYEPTRDKKAVTKIALKNIPELASVFLDFSEETYKEIFKEQIAPHLIIRTLQVRCIFIKGSR